LTARSAIVPEPEKFSIYQILKMLATGITWKSESDYRRVLEAIQTAEENNLFGIEGRMKL
jgi:hypothetical protein